MNIILGASRKQIVTLTCISKSVGRLEVLDSRFTIGFLFLGGNGISFPFPWKAMAGEGGRQGTEPPEAREFKGGRLQSPQWQLGDWGRYVFFSVSSHSELLF